MSFRLKTILGVALIEGCLLVVLVVSGVRYVTESNEHELALRARTSAESMASLIRDAVLTVDLAHLDAVAERALQSPGAVYVRIRDSERVMSQAGATEVLARPFVQDVRLAEAHDGVFDTGVDISDGDRAFGRVELGLSVEHANALIAAAQRHLSGIAVVGMLLVALFSYLLGTFLTRALRDLSRAARSITDGSLGALVDVKGVDELAAAGRAFNAMSMRLAESRREMERRIAEGHALSARLMEKEQRLAAILGSAVEGFVTIDECGTIDDVNDTGAALFGYGPAELAGHLVTDSIPEASRLPADDAEILRRPRRVDGLRKDGSTFPIEVTVSEMTLGDRRMYVGLITDLSDQMQAEAAARRSDSMRAAIVDANLDALVTIDAEDRVVEFSSVAEEIFGYRREDAVGQVMAELIVPPEMRAMHRRGIARYLETGEGTVIGNRIEVQAMRRGGELFPVELTVQQVEVGEQRFFIALVRDITSRKIEEQALMNAKRQAEVASEAKSRFLAHMSHEIRSPLNAILGSIGLLLDDDLDSDQRLYAQTAEASGKTLRSLINDILDFSKIEAGRVTLDRKDFAVRALVSEAMDLVALKARDKGLYVGAVIAPDVAARVLGDEARLRQVLTNLLDNAVKFTDSGTVTLQVDRRASPPAETRLRFTVEDTGIGIPEDSRSELFEEFHQADDSEVSRHGGSGLGLSICHSLVDLMGGCIDFDSEPSRGSRFWFEVSLALPERVGAEARPDETVGISPALAVGFHPKVGEVLQDIARGAGLELDCADRLEGPSPMQLDRYGTLLVNGALAGERIDALARRARDAGAERLVLVTPTTTAEVTQRVIDGQFDDLVLSPLREEELARTLRWKTEQGPESAGTTGADESGPAAGSRAGKIMLVEDSEANRLVAAALLRRRGLTVEIACNGLEAVECFPSVRPDLVLMDLRMPGMGGLEATAAIRALPEGAGTPIVAMTANAEEHDVQRCFAVGMDDFVAKPVNPGQLFEMLDRHLPSAPAHGAANGGTPADAPDWQSDLVLLDEVAIRQLANDVGEEAVPGMLRTFLDEVRGRVEVLTDPSTPAPGLEDEAHTLKSCAGTFGARRLQALAAGLETALREGRRGRVEDLSANLREVVGRTLEEYERRYDFLITSNAEE